MPKVTFQGDRFPDSLRSAGLILDTLGGRPGQFFGRRHAVSGERRLRGAKVKAVIVSGTVFFTIIFCLALGVACGYAAVSAILYGFGHRPQKQETAGLSTVHVSSGD